MTFNHFHEYSAGSLVEYDGNVWPLASVIIWFRTLDNHWSWDSRIKRRGRRGERRKEKILKGENVETRKEREKKNENESGRVFNGRKFLFTYRSS